MRLAFYMDVHVPQQITEALRDKGIDVLTAQEDFTTEMDDSALIDRATDLGRVLVSQDADMLREAKIRQETGEPFSGIVYGHQRKNTIGQAIRDLELIAEVLSSNDMANHVERIPLSHN
ncbi:MAG: DUF5615 family PIN-like protein [Planctomycetaceae bacterium]